MGLQRRVEKGDKNAPPVGAGEGEGPWQSWTGARAPRGGRRPASQVSGRTLRRGSSRPGLCGAQSRGPTSASPAPGAERGRYLFKSAGGRASAAPCDCLKGRAGRAAAGAEDRERPRAAPRAAEPWAAPGAPNSGQDGELLAPCSVGVGDPAGCACARACAGSSLTPDKKAGGAVSTAILSC